jgi:hypothetical protein
VKSGNIYHTDKWNVAATLLHILLIGMGSVAGTDYEIRFGTNQILSHEIERRTAIFPGSKDTSVSIGHLRVELDKRMDVRLVRLSSILYGGLTEDHTQEMESRLWTEATYDTAG